MLHSSDIAKLSQEDRKAFYASLTPVEAGHLAHLWEFWGRPEQMLPAGDWIYWIPLAGRGFGKTRLGAEAVRKWVQSSKYVNLIGATSDDVRSIMVEGVSGILAICPNDERPRYIANRRLLEWPNGSRSLLFSADEPDRLRGKNHEKIWADELAAWRYPDAWVQATLGLRIGARPQAVITTTPRPTKIMRELIGDPHSHVTRHSTYENIANLAQSFVEQIVKKYEGTRLGRQELSAEMLLDTPGALWTRDMIEAAFMGREDKQLLVHKMKRIVVAIDPSVSNTENSDETGLIVAGVGKEDDLAYVLEDASGRYSPNDWAKKAVELYRRWRADRVIAEVNNGGDLVENTLRIVDPTLSYRAVHASKGKVTRAEPVSALYEQGKVRHVGVFAKLEDQMCEFTSDFDRAKAGYSPDRVDALVWALTDLMLGFNPVIPIVAPYVTSQRRELPGQ